VTVLAWQRNLRVPVLLYHHVGASDGMRPGFLTISPAEFERHIAWLARRGYTAISLAQYLGWTQGKTVLPARPVLITFDDAYADISDHALPVLSSHGFTAVVFVVTALVGCTNVWDADRALPRRSLMTAPQIRDWAARGIEFGAHSRTHPDLRELSGSALTHEIAGSRKELEQIIGSPVISFAYPYGLYNNETACVVESTFELAFTTREGLNRSTTERHLLRRSAVCGSDNTQIMWRRLRWGRDPIASVRSTLRLRSRLRILSG
jgi:peptidoglycan/xylan/chitin deacetylase (PgdA/CDA1 family)